MLRLVGMLIATRSYFALSRTITITSLVRVNTEIESSLVKLFDAASEYN